jgi:hypothetical protein
MTIRDWSMTGTTLLQGKFVCEFYEKLFDFSQMSRLSHLVRFTTIGQHP